MKNLKNKLFSDAHAITYEGIKKIVSFEVRINVSLLLCLRNEQLINSRVRFNITNEIN